MTKKTGIDEQDLNDFRQAVKGVKPLKQNSKVSLKKTTQAPSPTLRKKKEPEIEELEEFSDFEHLAPVSGDDIVQFSRPGIQHKILRNLRNGKYNVEATLDLHGKTVIEAREELSRFLAACRQEGIRHVIIIHGKGRSNSQPILKNKLNHWLRQTTQVLAFCSATVRDGRGGALYVLLKKETLA